MTLTSTPTVAGRRRAAPEHQLEAEHGARTQRPPRARGVVVRVLVLGQKASEAGYPKNMWINFGSSVQKVCVNPIFDNFMLLVVCIAGVLVGMQTGYDMDGPIFDLLDTIIMFIFMAELVMKILMNPLMPWHFFTGSQRSWNWFDFAIVVLSIPGVFANASALRLLRLARTIKIVNKIPKLKVIVSGMIAGLGDVFYILLLMGIVFYVYAVLGVSLFQANDPWHFKDMGFAFQTLFKIASLDDWTKVWYINYFGCAYYNYGLYIPRGYDLDENGLFIEGTLNVTAVSEQAHLEHPLLVNGVHDPTKFYCTDSPSSTGQHWVSSFFFISHVVISALVLLSLFVGSITLSMMSAIEAIAADVKASKGKARMQKLQLAFDNVHTLNERKRSIKICKLTLAAWCNADREGVQQAKLDDCEVLVRYGVKHKMAIERIASGPVLVSNKFGQIDAPIFMDPAADLNDEEADRYKGLTRAYFLCSVRCKYLTENPGFQKVINFFII